MSIALTRSVSPSIARAELTHLEREPIDLERAREQHAQYEAILESLGCTVRRLDPEPECPDAVFVEDMAVVLPELAVITRPGAESRRAETTSVAEALRSFRSLGFIEAPGTVDGGDVLRVARELFVGHTGRTNEQGIRQLRELVAPHGYTVTTVPVTGCLHLKTAVTQVGEGTVLLNPDWIDPARFAHLECIEIDPGEPFAANALRIGSTVLLAAAHPKTRARLEARGFAVASVPADELARAEGALTCCSLLVEEGPETAM